MTVPRWGVQTGPAGGRKVDGVPGGPLLEFMGGVAWAAMAFIGVTTSAASTGGTPRVHLNTAYLHALQAAGGIPVLLPPFLEQSALDALLENLDGVMLTGGGDVDPSRYGEKPHPQAVGISAPRDTLEAQVTLWALANRKPLFAICRGMQVLNVVLGGSLFQHIPEHFGDAIAHSQTDAGFRRDEQTHSVDVRGGSLLANLIGAGSVGVNSMHHQAIRRAGNHLLVSARAPDGVIEAVEAPSLAPFVVGVQWHPEELAAAHESAANLFRAFVAVSSGEDVNRIELKHAIRV